MAKEKLFSRNTRILTEGQMNFEPLRSGPVLIGELLAKVQADLYEAQWRNSCSSFIVFIFLK